MPLDCVTDVMFAGAFPVSEIPPLRVNNPDAESAASDLKKLVESILSNVAALTFVIFEPFIAAAVPVRFDAGKSVRLAPDPLNVPVVNVLL